MGNSVRTNQRKFRMFTMAALGSMLVVTICTAGLISCPKTFSSDQNLSSDALESFPCHAGDAPDETDCRCSEIGLGNDSYNVAIALDVAPLKSDLLFYLSYLPLNAFIDFVIDRNLSSITDTTEYFSDSVRLLI
ncbi:hypothetical protein JWG40_00260 [Leptospira sp. 201903074]|uniref:hypothetical protein n=1 Tax=Leptospira abararensis TaxID=2810036 RepID=UPI0019644806|nr:hypothetical protein [Leptospira abararensis]MBM9545432.1 hypothetical protein [Leptospira abararensis]